MTPSRYKRLQETAKAKGKILLIEEFSHQPLAEDVQLFKDTPQLFEYANGTSTPSVIKAIGVVRNVPVSRFTENKNRRIYSRALWERVQKTGAFNYGFGLSDHAKDEASTKDIMVLWKNFRVLENIAVADAYIVDPGPLGQKMLIILAEGGKLGWSTVGYGTFEPDGKTVIAEEYELSEESVCDWVLNPSQSVYATQENLVSNDSVIQEKHNTNLIERRNNTPEPVKETIMSDQNTKMLEAVQKTHVANLKTTIMNKLKEATAVISARKISDFDSITSELKSTLTNISALDSFGDEQTAITESLNKIEALKIEIMTKQAEDILKKEETVDTLSKKLKEMSEVLNDTQSKYVSSNEIISALKEKSASEIAELTEKVKVYEDDIEFMKTERNALKEDLANADASYDGLKEDLAYLEGVTKEQAEKITALTAREEELTADARKKVSETFALKKELAIAKEKKPTDDLFKIQNKNLLEKVKNLTEEVASLTKENEALRKKTTVTTPVSRPSRVIETAPSRPNRVVTRSQDDYLKTELKKIFKEEVQSLPGLADIEADFMEATSISEAYEILEAYTNPSSISGKTSLKETATSAGDDYYPSGDYLSDIIKTK